MTCPSRPREDAYQVIHQQNPEYTMNNRRLAQQEIDEAIQKAVKDLVINIIKLTLIFTFVYMVPSGW